MEYLQRKLDLHFTLHNRKMTDIKTTDQRRVSDYRNFNKLAVQRLSVALCFVSIFGVAESLTLSIFFFSEYSDSWELNLPKANVILHFESLLFPIYG